MESQVDRTHQPIDTHRKIVEFVEQGCPFVVALVLRAEGSTPRGAGTKAVIGSDGKIWGTVGGGAVEAESQRRALEALELKQPIVFDFHLEGTDRKADVPICGGVMRMLVDPTAARNKTAYTQVADAIRQRQRGVLLTTIRAAAPAEVELQWFPEGGIPSQIDFPDAESISRCLDRETAQLFSNGVTQSATSVDVLVEPVIPKPRLLIVGAGHIGQALAVQAVLVGFDVTVVDDRAEFTDPALFPEAVTTLCGDIPKEVADFPIAEDTYVVVVTRGHKHDAGALRACINKPAAYIGMIGSKRKVALMKKDFIETGIATEEQFGRVFAPIGLDIGALTVPEIATSIVAQLVDVRRKGRDHALREGRIR
ncbi:MAG: XdhC family protein [Phycisphaerales bacterium]|nr:MAG: XdhC family protein [Phycisphaerales bacterium]